MAGSPAFSEASGFHSVLLSAIARIELKLDRIDSRIVVPRNGRQLDDPPRDRASGFSSSESHRRLIEDPSTDSFPRQISPAGAAADIVSEARLSSVGMTGAGLLEDAECSWTAIPHGASQASLVSNGNGMANGFQKLELIPCPRKPAEMTMDEPGADVFKERQQARLAMPQLQEKALEEQQPRPSIRSNASVSADEHRGRKSVHSKGSTERLTLSDGPSGVVIEAKLRAKKLFGVTDSERDEVPPLPEVELGRGSELGRSMPSAAGSELGRSVEYGHQPSMKAFRVDSRKDTIDKLNQYTMSYGVGSVFGSQRKRPILKESKSAMTSNECEFELLERISQRARGHHRGEAVDGVWTFLTDPASSYGAALFFHIMNPLIAASTVLVLTEGAHWFSQSFIGIAEAVINAFFLVEIVVRFATCPSRLAFARHLYNIIDIVALLPFLFRCAVGLTTELDVEESNTGLENAIAAFVLGGTPFLRLLKLLRRYERFHLILRCFEESLEALPVMFYMICLLSLLFSTLLYICEPRENIKHVTDALWLTIVTMLTVGYGDTYPVSGGGKLVAVGLMFAGMLFMAIPIGIIGNTFNNVWERRVHLLVVLRTRERLKQWGYQPSDIPNFFELADRRNLGYLTYKQFRSLLSAMHVKMSDHAFRMLFEVFDQDGNGQVDHWEFLRVVFPEYYYDVCGPGIEEEVRNETAPSVGATLTGRRKSLDGSSPSIFGIGYSGQKTSSNGYTENSGSPVLKGSSGRSNCEADYADRSGSSSIPSDLGASRKSQEVL